MKIETLVFWKNPTSNKEYPIAKLCYDDIFTFEYLDLSKAKKDSFVLLGEFKENKLYESVDLFLTFRTRLPCQKRTDWQKFLKTKNLDITSNMLLQLITTDGRLYTDTIFIKKC